MPQTAPLPKTAEETLSLWHRFVATGDASLLPSLLADDVVLRTPVYWKERKGAEVHLILSCVPRALGPITYVRQWIDGKDWALEFSGRIDDIDLKGIDLVTLGDDNRITLLEVMLRPPNAGTVFRARMEALVGGAMAELRKAQGQG